MAVKIPNLIQRNGIYYFRCRIPSNLTDGQYREVKVSLKTRTFDSLLFESIRRTSDYLQQIVFDVSRKHRIDNANYVFEIRKQISQYIKNILVESEFYEKVHRNVLYFYSCIFFIIFSAICRIYAFKSFGVRIFTFPQTLITNWAMSYSVKSCSFTLTELSEVL